MGEQWWQKTHKKAGGLTGPCPSPKAEKRREAIQSQLSLGGNATGFPGLVFFPPKAVYKEVRREGREERGAQHILVPVYTYHFKIGVSLLYIASFLLSSEANQPYVCIRPLPLVSPFPAPSHPSRSSRSTKLRSLHCTPGPHWLAVLYMAAIYVNSPIHPTPLSLLPCPHIFSLCLHL